jgi:hypothetical protein
MPKQRDISSTFSWTRYWPATGKVSPYLLNQSDVQNTDRNPALKDMGADFLNSYTQLVDGEKDPRNLLLLFAMDRVILLEFDVSAHIEVI